MDPLYPTQGIPAGDELPLALPHPHAHVHGQAAGEINFNDPTGKYKLVLGGVFAAVEVSINNDDKFKAEGGAMVTMSQNVDLVVSLEGGCCAAYCRCCCANESAFFSYFHVKPNAATAHGDVLLSPSMPGDIILLNLDGKTEWRVQKGSYLASDNDVKVGVALQGVAKGCCSGEGFFVLKAHGTGRLLLNSFGSMIRYDLQPGEKRVIDNGFLVAWQADMQYSIRFGSSSLFSTVFSGEGFVCEFTGPGVIYAQTRTIKKLANVLDAYYNGSGAGGI